MVRVGARKRLIPEAHLRQLAEDILEHQAQIEGADAILDHLVEHLKGVIDAHCVLLQRALCVHCGNGVPLVFVEQWGDFLHNGEVTCIASAAREIMGIEPTKMHILRETGNGSTFL